MTTNSDLIKLPFYFFCNNKKTIALLLLFIFHFNFALARKPPASASVLSGFRFFLGPSVAFYKINSNHAQLVSSKMSAFAGFRKQIRCDKFHKTFFLTGLDYFFHGLNFNSYYFKPDSIKLYDKKFNYTYSVFIHEIHLPLQIKYSFTPENNSLFSPYAMIGYHLRILLPANVKVSQGGAVQAEKTEELKFKNSLYGNDVNSFVSVSLGWQKNAVNHSKFGFFAEINYRYGFSQYYFQSNYSASALYINSSHLSFYLGLNF